MKKFLSALLGAALLSSLVVTPAFAGKKAKAAKKEAPAAVQVIEEKTDEVKEIKEEVKMEEVK